LTALNIPNKFVGNEKRNVTALNSNFEAIAKVVNGNLDATNLSDEYQAELKEAYEASQIKKTSGTGTLTWTGGSAAEEKVAHGLGKVPSIVLVVFNETGPEAPIMVVTKNYTETEFTVEGWTSHVANGTAKFTWVALS
jgi:hypothetical protein